MNQQQLNVLTELIQAYGGEALFRPSSADRFIGCPGSVRLIARVPQIEQAPTSYQAEGTAAHFIAEQALNGEHAPEEWVDRVVHVGPRGVCAPGNMTIPVSINEEFIAGVDAYLETISSLWRPDIEQYIEYKLSLAALDPADPLLAQNRGTADVVQLDYRQRILRLFDLKFGRGVMVAATSPQPKDYALQALYTFAPPRGGWERVEVHIEQPRAQNESERRKQVTYDPYDLLNDFVGEVVGAMEAALEPDPPLNPGARCRWCPAAQAKICPALEAAALDFEGTSNRRFTAGDALTALPEHVFIGTAEQPLPMVARRDTIVLPDTGGLSGARTAQILDRLHLFETWAAGVRHHAVTLLGVGSDVPGWKLGRRTKRMRWKDAKTAPDALGEMGLNGVFAPAKLKTPKQIMKTLTPDQKLLFDQKGLAEIPLGDVILIPADSSKAALLPALGPIENEDD